MIVLGIVYILAMYPGYIFTKISELLRPIIIEQAQTVIDDNRNSITKSLNGLIKSIKEIIAESDAGSPITPQATTPVVDTSKSPTTTTQKAKTPIKKTTAPRE